MESRCKEAQVPPADRSSWIAQKTWLRIGPREEEVEEEEKEERRRRKRRKKRLHVFLVTGLHVVIPLFSQGGRDARHLPQRPEALCELGPNPTSNIPYPLVSPTYIYGRHRHPDNLPGASSVK